MGPPKLVVQWPSDRGHAGFVHQVHPAQPNTISPFATGGDGEFDAAAGEAEGEGAEDVAVYLDWHDTCGQGELPRINAAAWGLLRWSCCLPGSGGPLKAGVRESATSATGRCEAHCGVVCGSSGLSFRSS